MSFDQIARTIELLFGLLGLLFVVFGWVIPYRQSLSLEKERKKSEIEYTRIQWEKEQIDNQIAKFYGPISALLDEQDILFSRITYQLERKTIFKKDHDTIADLPENEASIWKHYIDTYKIPLSKEIVKIIRENIHLVYKSEIPTCFKTYMDYTLGWELLDNQKRNGVPNYYEYHYSFNYPIEFSMYIHDTLTLLLKQQAALISNEKKNSIAF